VRRIVVTGGAGFIGSAVVRRLVGEGGSRVINVDALTYAGNLESVASVAGSPHYVFEHADVADAEAMARVFATHRPDAVLHLAAESHVDRSIDGAAAFVRTNVVGTQVLLDAARQHWASLDPASRQRFRVVHVSTDEVFGSLGADGTFTEASPHRPNSPYAASKAAADHLARAWHRTYGVPVIVTNCSNNYGPYQFPEKLIPLAIQRALVGEPVPVYGTGANVRDWLHVDDHVDALLRVLDAGEPGRTYLIGGDAERRTIDVARAVCTALDALRPDPAIGDRTRLIHFVATGRDTTTATRSTRRARGRSSGGPRGIASRRGCARRSHGTSPTGEWTERVLSGAYRLQRLGLGAVTGGRGGRVRSPDVRSIGQQGGADPRARGARYAASCSPGGRVRASIRSRASSASSCCRCTTSR
jgi:dTDP-glucose 4,6-dehydratase